jgi:hypothetical protein
MEQLIFLAVEKIIASTGDLKPFTNYSIEKPYTYQTSVATGEGLPTYHVKVAAAVIKKYLDIPSTSTPFTALQGEIAQNNPRALQVAAVLRQVGDGLSPLPEDVQIQMSLMEMGGQATFNTQQKGTITFSESPTPSSPIEIRINDEIVIQESDGTMIGKNP